jgi:alkylated DNA repair protein alkB homolog 6
MSLLAKIKAEKAKARERTSDSVQAEAAGAGGGGGEAGVGGGVGEVWRWEEEVEGEREGRKEELAMFAVRVPVGDVFVWPEYVGEEAGARFVRWLESKERKWVRLRRRRLMMFGGRVGSDADGLSEAEELPPLLLALAKHLVARGVFPADKQPNHALVNWYEPGEGIAPHTDGPAYFPLVATLSLGSAALFRFEPRVEAALIGTEAHAALRAAQSSTLLLPPRALTVFCRDAYSSMMHSVAEATEEEVPVDCANAPLASLSVGDRFPRLRRFSITMRHVPHKP